MEINNFPRKLTEAELKILYSVLPESKPGYKIYREKVQNMYVVGAGRFGGNNFILGEHGSKPDLTISSAPVFALGTLAINNLIIDVIIHEEQDNQIEYDISSDSDLLLEKDIRINNIKTYSNWIPSDNLIFNESQVRQYLISKDKFVLAISPEHKKIWLHNVSTGVNHIIPVTNIFNELMRLKNIRDPNRALSPKFFFENINDYSAIEIKDAFILYNKYLKKFQIPEDKNELSNNKSGKKIFKIFSRG